LALLLIGLRLLGLGGRLLLLSGGGQAGSDRKGDQPDRNSPISRHIRPRSSRWCLCEMPGTCIRETIIKPKHRAQIKRIPLLEPRSDCIGTGSISLLGRIFATQTGVHPRLRGDMLYWKML
jgi:hypothetical protein